MTIISNRHASDAATIEDVALNLKWSPRYSYQCPFVSCCDGDGGDGVDVNDFEYRSIDGVNDSFDLTRIAMDRSVESPHLDHF